MPISLENRLRRILVVNLPHDVCCAQGCACSKATIVVAAENPRTGDRVTQHVTRDAAASLTWLALERRDDLPDHLLEVPEVKAALSCGHLRLAKQSAAPAQNGTVASATRATPTAPDVTASAVVTAMPKEPR
jgi:hypothetical protein